MKSQSRSQTDFGLLWEQRNDKLEENRQTISWLTVACAKRTVKQSLESIKVNTNLLRRDSQIIKDYLTSSNELLAAWFWLNWIDFELQMKGDYQFAL